MLIRGRLQSVDGVIHVRAGHVEALEAGELSGGESHDFQIGTERFIVVFSGVFLPQRR